MGSQASATPAVCAAGMDGRASCPWGKHFSNCAISSALFLSLPFGPSFSHPSVVAYQGHLPHLLLLLSPDPVVGYRVVPMAGPLAVRRQEVGQPEACWMVRPPACTKKPLEGMRHTLWLFLFLLSPQEGVEHPSQQHKAYIHKQSLPSAPLPHTLGSSLLPVSQGWLVVCVMHRTLVFPAPQGPPSLSSCSLLPGRCIQSKFEAH